MIDHSLSLWQLLVRITLNKIRRQAEHHHAARRDVAAEVHDDGELLRLEGIAHDPTPDEAAAFAEELQVPNPVRF